MAKKPAAASDETAKPKDDAPAPEKAKGEKKKPEAKPEKGEAKEAKPETSEKTPKKKKAAAEKKPAGEQTPAQPGKPVAASPAVEAKPAAAVAPSGDGQAERKKKKKPGTAPSRGKKLKNHLRNIQQKLLKEGPQPLKKAVSTLKSLKRSKMDETVEIHIFLGVDPTQSDQLIRGSVSLPNGIGKSVRVLVFCQSDNVAKAKAAGADFAGGAELIEKIQKENWLDFDIALATQDMMGQVSRLGKVLGPRGLMPTPKAGTVVSMTQDIGEVVKEFKAGKVEFRTDAGGNVHALLGKRSFAVEDLRQNLQAFLDHVSSLRPPAARGAFFRKISISTSMGPGVLIAWEVVHA